MFGYQVCLNVRTYTCMHVYVCMYIHMYVCMYVHAYVSVYTYVCFVSFVPEQNEINAGEKKEQALRNK